MREAAEFIPDHLGNFGGTGNIPHEHGQIGHIPTLARHGPIFTGQVNIYNSIVMLLTLWLPPRLFPLDTGSGIGDNGLKTQVA